MGGRRGRVSSRVTGRGIRRGRRGPMLRFVSSYLAFGYVLTRRADVAGTSTCAHVACTRLRCGSQRRRDSWHRPSQQFSRVAQLCGFTSSISRRLRKKGSACQSTCDGGVQSDRVSFSVCHCCCVPVLFSCCLCVRMCLSLVYSMFTLLLLTTTDPCVVTSTPLILMYRSPTVLVYSLFLLLSTSTRMRHARVSCYVRLRLYDVFSS